MQQNYEHFHIKESPLDFLSYKCYNTQMLNILVFYTGVFYIHLYGATTFMGMMSTASETYSFQKLQSLKHKCRNIIDS